MTKIALMGLALWWLGAAGVGPSAPGSAAGPGQPAACPAPAPPPAMEMRAGVRVVAAPGPHPQQGTEAPRPALDTPGAPCFLPRPRIPEELP